MNGRKKISAVIQILLSTIGLVGLGYMIFAYVSFFQLLGGNAESVGEAVGIGIAAALMVYLLLIISIIPFICGFINTIISGKQRRFDETRDAFSLTLLIIGIVMMALPIILDLSIFIIGKLN